MTSDEMKSVIVLDGGSRLEVDSSPDQVESLIDGVTSRHIPLIRVVDLQGVEHHINANYIVEFSELPGRV